MSQRGLVPAGSGQQVLLAQQRTLEQRTSASSTTVRESHSRGQETRVSQQTFTSQQHQTSSTHRGKRREARSFPWSRARLSPVRRRDFPAVPPGGSPREPGRRGEGQRHVGRELEYFWARALARPEIDARARPNRLPGREQKESREDGRWPGSVRHRRGKKTGAVSTIRGD